MTESNDDIISSVLNMLGEHPEEKIASLLSQTELPNTETQHAENTDTAPVDGDALLTVGNLLSQMQQSDDRAKLLSAIKPFVSNGKGAEIDRIIRLLKLAKMAETAQKNDLFKNFNL